MDNLTTKQVNNINRITTKTKDAALGTKIFDIIAQINTGMGPAGPTGDKGATGDKGPTGDSGICTEIPSGTPVNAISASKSLAITGVVINGETVTINNPEVPETSDVYEFVSATDLRVTTEGNIPVDINASTAKATDNLTVDTNPSVGDTMTIGTKVFTFVPNGTANADGEIDVETLLADTQANIVAAIMGTDGHNDPHALAKCGAAFAADVLAITAIYGGAAGNNIATTETFTAETNVFSAVKLAGGTDCSAANAVTALAAAITASDTQGVGGADGAGDTVDLTADVGGVVGNDIEIAETMANGAFAGAAVKLSGGVDGTAGDARTVLVDASYLYIAIAEQTINDKNWRRISLGTAF